MIGAGIFFLYALVKKPDWVALMLFALIVADINFKMQGVPLRTTVTILLFMRTYGEQRALGHPGFFSNGLTMHMIAFVVYMMAVTAMNGLLDVDLIKEFLLCCVSAYLAYYYYFKNSGHDLLKNAMIVGGLICLADLVYTYGSNGGFPVIRVFYQFVPEAFAFNNHNFFGYICGTAFVFLLSDYLTAKTANKYTLLLMPLMFLGVLLSTSRGSLVAMIILTIFLLGKGLMSKTKGKRASRILSITVVCVVLAIFILPIATSILGISSEFLEMLTKRLVDEPMGMINKMMGNSYQAESMETVEWREEASNLAYNYYKNLPGKEQALGIGYNGFLARDVGHGYDAHNGILLLMIELGFIGTIIYSSLVLSFWSNVRKLKLSSPAFNSIIFIILYVTSHNKEITSFFAFSIMGSLIAEIRYATMPQEEVSEEEQFALANEYE
jgi:O-Antigen ligase